MANRYKQKIGFENKIIEKRIKARFVKPSAETKGKYAASRPISNNALSPAISATEAYRRINNPRGVNRPRIIRQKNNHCGATGGKPGDKTKCRGEHARWAAAGGGSGVDSY